MRLHKTRLFIIDKLQGKFVDTTHYHGVAHSLEVEEACLKICKNDININKIDIELLQIAALSHDIGHAEKRNGHEVLGCHFITNNLPNFGYSNTEIEQIKDLILATKFPHNPKSILEEIICDADLSYIGLGDYFEQSNRLKKELTEAYDHKFNNEVDWLLYQLDFLSNHKFFTEYAKNNFDPVKRSIITHIEQKLSTK